MADKKLQKDANFWQNFLTLLNPFSSPRARGSIARKSMEPVYNYPTKLTGGKTLTPRVQPNPQAKTVSIDPRGARAGAQQAPQMAAKPATKQGQARKPQKNKIKVSACKQLLGVMSTKEKRAGRFWDTLASWNPFRLIPGGQDFFRRSGSAKEIKAQNKARAMERARAQKRKDMEYAVGKRKAGVGARSAQRAQVGH